MGLYSELSSAARRPDEFVAVIRYKTRTKKLKRRMSTTQGPGSIDMADDWSFCFEFLSKVSRSFAAVILELDDELRYPVAVFYLVLRGLDTVEDDTSSDAKIRMHLCQEFHKKLQDPKWKTDQFGSGSERELLASFDRVTKCFHALKPQYRQVILDITQRMGDGMAQHIHDVCCDSVDDYDRYCHYVAGLVGHGLSRMFSASGRESEEFAARDHLSNSMGLFLQKTNIIRDYLEDIDEGRTFWPREIWSQYGDRLEELKEDGNRKFAVAALNHMITDALRHVPDCIEYMSHIRNPHVFNFVAIPQVMAIGTLAECYNNPRVFEGVVKLRRSLTAKLIVRTKTMTALYQLFFDSAHVMLKKVENSDPNAEKTRALLNTIIDITFPHLPTNLDLRIPNVLSIIAFGGLSHYVLQRRQQHYDGAVFTWRSAGGIMEPGDMLAIGLLFLVCTYFFSFFGLQYFSGMRLSQRTAGHPLSGKLTDTRHTRRRYPQGARAYQKQHIKRVLLE
eukprot:Plantae.Rhodophyta-Hildenbrandia_rubra.ctg26560.p1 GENE.Plantae.Rhodophyta-Hildenbrandia_rubra.ctg26560~~Plantae.Rhodophyta-Hildenbrandia_rubra.ctg26560.p1  ORF type:complete len:505 (-),score=63.64 Plantae.Rhodophyta-Hildenbrandia_rubra.ctg26560:220-1734(-)